MARVQAEITATQFDVAAAREALRTLDVNQANCRDDPGEVVRPEARIRW